MALPQPTPITYANIDLLDASGAVLASYRVLEKLGNYMLRNVEPMQPVEGNIQTYQGDDRITIGEHTAELLLEGDVGPISRELLETTLTRHLWNCSKIQIGDYQQTIARMRGITTTAPIGVRSKYKYRATIAYIPKENFWVDAASGVAGAANASQALYTVTAGGSAFLASDAYKLIRWGSGEEAQILEYISATEVVVDRPRTVASGAFSIYNTVIGVL